ALQHMTEPPDLTPLPESDRAAVARALAKEPTKRFPTCKDFILALSPGASALLAPEPVADGDEADLGTIDPGPGVTNRLDGLLPAGAPVTAVVKEARPPDAESAHTQVLQPPRAVPDVRVRTAPPRATD